MNEFKLQPRAAQTTSFSPRLQRAVRLLQMSSQDYRRALLDAAEQNPFLDLDDNAPEAEAEAEAEAGAGAEADGEATASGSDRDNPLWAAEAQAYESRRGVFNSEEVQAFENVAIPRSLQRHLHDQIGVLRLRPMERVLADAVVEGLDDDGYLRVALDDLRSACDTIGTINATQMENALAVVQQCEPAGVGARSVQECLLLQLAARPACEVRAVAVRIVKEQLVLLTTRRTHRLASALGATLEVTRCAVECIRSLDPHPGWKCSDSVARAITVDVAVRKTRGVWVTKLNASALPTVTLNSLYSDLMRRHCEPAHAELVGCLEAAKWTVSNLAQRMATILEVARAIVHQQGLFLEFGPLAMKPLSLRDVAQEVGVHPSTVSRAVHDKYIQTPHGVFELRRFFSRGTEHASGSPSAPTALRGLLQELIGAEAPAEPASDAALALQLTQQGFRIARRTVTKYRQELGIGSVERRRAAWLERDSSI